jgi:hypothetical protein
MMLRRRAQRKRERIFSDITNPLDYLDDDAIVSKSRLSQPLIFNLCNIVSDRLQRTTARSRALPVAIALRYNAYYEYLVITS